MSLPDDLSPLKEPSLNDALEKLEELMTQSGRALLIGAGCSKCAGLPLTTELSEKALSSVALDSNTIEVLQAVQSNFTGATNPTIEDFLSELVDLLAIAERREERSATTTGIQLGSKSYSSELLRTALEQIKRAIAEVINQPVSIDVHRSFVKAIHRPVRPGKSASNNGVEYLVLNYDTLIEDALALEKVPFADGMEGGVTGWWNPSTFSQEGLTARVFKLHGSINWTELADDPLPRRIPANVFAPSAEDRLILIWPASTKYRETQKDPYAQIAAHVRTILRPGNGSQRVLAVCGYRFMDSHINIELDRALRESAGRLTIIAFWSEEKLEGILKDWHDDLSIRDQLLVYGRRGFWHGDKVVPSSSDLPWWKFENLTRLLGGER